VVFSKVLQIVEKRLMSTMRLTVAEAADWWSGSSLGGARNSCTAGYKAMVEARGFPSNDILLLNPKLAAIIDDKMARDIKPIGAKAGS
jgi:ribulose kinase